MSYRPEVIADSSGEWTGNGLRFATEAEALGNVRALESRWFAVRETRVVESADPVNYAWVDGRLVSVPPAPQVYVSAEIADAFGMRGLPNTKVIE